MHSKQSVDTVLRFGFESSESGDEAVPTTVRPLTEFAAWRSRFAPFMALLTELRSGVTAELHELERVVGRESVSNLLPVAIATWAMLGAVVAGAVGAALR